METILAIIFSGALMSSSSDATNKRCEVDYKGGFDVKMGQTLQTEINKYIIKIDTTSEFHWMSINREGKTFTYNIQCKRTNNNKEGEK
jgi:hypothetical protein